jgi:hypothetical protein
VQRGFIRELATSSSLITFPFIRVMQNEEGGLRSIHDEVKIKLRTLGKIIRVGQTEE